MGPENTEDRHLKEILETGSSVAGSVAGTALGLIMGGPSGAFAGAVGGPLAGRTTLYLASEFKHRVLSQREEERIGGTMAFAIEKIQENIAEGKQLRQDGFFQDHPTQRSAAKEVFEGVLLAAQQEHEEKKLSFYGNLLANVAFDYTINREQANLLTKEGQSLSYRQLCVLALVAAKQLFEGERRISELKPISGIGQQAFNLKQESYENTGGVPNMNVAALLHEIFDLHARNLASTGVDMPGSTYIEPSNLRLALVGYNLYRLMELWGIDKDDAEEVASLLR